MEASSTTSFFSSPPQAAAAAAAPTDIDAVSLNRLSTHLERLLDPAFPNRADIEIVLASGGSGGDETGAAAIVGAHSCILAARSAFFLQYFSSIPTTAAAVGGKARLNLADIVPVGRHIGRDALVAVLGYLYTGRLKVPPQECVDEACRHGACRPAIDFVVESTYAAFAFQIPELVKLLQRRLSDIVDIASDIVDIAYDEDIIPIIRVASKCQLSDLLTQCIQRVATWTLDDNFLEKELAGDIYNDIKKRRCLTVDELDASIVDAEHEKRVADIHKALDSGNVDLVSMLLKQYGVTLDEALAIHYAATYCEPKVLQELLKLDHTNVNMKNSGGYTPLHMACMRLEPDIIVALLDKGASVLEQTRDRRDALTICKRLTRHQEDVNRELKKGQEISKPYLCIFPILEEIKRTLTDQVSLEEAITRLTPLRVDNFTIRLVDLECRVTLAKQFFPSVAKLAMRIAEADSTEEFASAALKNDDLNESLDWRFRERFDALTRTVELGRRYFPSCSDVLDKFLAEDSALTLLENSTAEDQVKKMQFHEIRNEVQKAFDKDTTNQVINSMGLATVLLQLLYKRGMLDLGTNPSQAKGAADSSNAHAPPSGLFIQAPSANTASRQLESQIIDVAVDDDVGVGSKRKLKSPVWDEFKRVKTGDDWFAICMRCQQRLKACSKNGTSRLHRHLKICPISQATNQSTLKMSQNPEESTITLEKNVFDQDCARKELALMICIHEYPLSIVEHAGFRKFCAAMQPMFKVVSKNTIRKDILDIYEMKKILMVKHFQQFQARVAVTVDTWTMDHSNKSYMAITAHYIDDNWKLKRYLLRFIYVPTPYTGEVISDVLHKVLMEWHIEKKLSTVSLDNCTIDNIMDKMLNKLTLGCLMLDGSFLHTRHAAQKLNLIVQDGMAVMDKGIERVRQSVAFWVATPKRHEKFEKVASQMNVKYDNRIALDCKTRWNSTYVMLSTALEYQEVFVCLAQSEKLFTPCCPTSAEWKFAREVCDRLKVLFDITEVLSDTTYVSANLFFPKLCSIYLDIRKWQASDPLSDPLIESMSQLLKQKFEKYWSDVCVPMAVATVLDPRYKLHLLNAVFIKIYGKEGANQKVAEVRKLLYNLVSQYNNYVDSDATACSYPTSAVQNQGNNEVFELFDEYMSCHPVASPYVHAELDVYLNESVLPRTQELDIIHWWQFEGTKYPTLRKIAQDIMAISMTTVPSKSVFSTGGRTISPHRSQLAPNMVEALMCVQDWSCADMLGPDFANISSLTS